MDLPGGRLDLDTSGPLLLTNDSELAEYITNPESHVAKTYLVRWTRSSTTNNSISSARASI